MSASKFGTYDQVGQVEDVSDIISDITPTDTPFQTLIGSMTTKSTTFEWQEDSLAAVAVNAQVLGADAPAAAQTATTMRSNYTQLFMKTVSVTGTAQAIDLYGRANELAHQLSKKGKEIKRDLEHALVGLSTAKVAGDDVSTARKMASAYQLIDSGVTSSNSGTPRALTEALVLDVMELLYTAGGEFDTVMIKPGDAEVVANFSYKDAGSSGYAVQRSRDVGNGKKIVNAVEVYEGPYGTARFVLNRFIKTTEALVFDPSNFKTVWLRKWRKEALAKTGDSDKFMLLGEVSLKHTNFSVSGRITDLS